MRVSWTYPPLAAGFALLILGSQWASAGETRRARPLPIARNAEPQQVATGYQFTEGPAVDAAGNVFFSDSPANRILVIPSGGSARVWREGTRGANGMLFDRQGRLVTCNSQLAPDGRSVTRYEKDGRVTVLADRYQGKKLNSPNDLCVDSDGNLYFTDPRYGDLKDLEQDRQAVYRLEKDGKLTRVIDDVQVPNGILISPDDRTLYVADNNPAPGGARTVLAYELDSRGRAGRKRVLHDFGTGRGGDGMALDVDGNLYVTAGEGDQTGVYVLSREGRLLQFVRTPETATNCTFGGPDLRTLYITAGKSVYRVRTRVTGYLAYPSRRQAERRTEERSYLEVRDPRLPADAPQIVATAEDAGGYAAFPDITRNERGELVCVFYAGYGHVSHPKDGWEWGGKIMATVSRDEGLTWTRPRMIIDTPHDDRDPHVAKLADGRLVLTWFSTWDPQNVPRGEKHPHGLFMSVSRDGGLFWTEPQRIRIGGERWWVASAPVRELKDGTLVQGLYTMDKETGHAWGGTIRSEDGGATWTGPAEIGAKAGLPLDAETDVIQLKDGRVLAALRSSKVNLHFAWSNDGARSWSEPKDAGFQGHCPLFLRLRNDTLLLGHRLPNTALHWSTDEGLSWQGPFQVDNVIGAYPGLVQLKNDDVLCVYYEEGSGSRIRARRLRVDREGVRPVPPDGRGS